MYVSGGASPLGTSPSTTNSNSSLFSNFTSSINSHHHQQQQQTNNHKTQHHHNQHQTQQPNNTKFHNNNNNHDCAVMDMTGCNSNSNVPSTGSSPSSANTTTANFHISSLPFSLVGALRGSSSNNSSSNANTSSSVNGGSPTGRDCSPSVDCVSGGGGGVSVVPYLLCCETVEHRRRFEECKSMVQLPNGFDRLEWLAYHGMSYHCLPTMPPLFTPYCPAMAAKDTRSKTQFIQAEFIPGLEIMFGYDLIVSSPSRRGGMIMIMAPGHYQKR